MAKLIKIANSPYIKNGTETQDNLTSQDIKNLLEDYIELSDYNHLKLGMHIRYFISKVDAKGKKQKLFRLGGNIIKIDENFKYVILSNGKLSWSVQLNDSTIIYKKMNNIEIKNIYENEIDNKNIDIAKYKKYIQKIKENYEDLLKNYNIILSKYDKLKLEIKKIKKN